MNFLASLESLSFSVWVREGGSIWGYPTILCLHTMGMATVAGIAAMISMRLLGVAPTMAIKPMERLYPLMWAGFWLNAVTGTMLLLADATTKLTNPDFYVKMLLILVGVVVLNIMRKRVFSNPQLDLAPVPGNAKSLAWVSLACWLGAIISGRLLAYVGPVSGLAGK